jgi:hypothetical protein
MGQLSQNESEMGQLSQHEMGQLSQNDSEPGQLSCESRTIVSENRDNCLLRRNKKETKKKQSAAAINERSSEGHTAVNEHSSEGWDQLVSTLRRWKLPEWLGWAGDKRAVPVLTANPGEAAELVELAMKATTWSSDNAAPRVTHLREYLSHYGDELLGQLQTRSELKQRKAKQQEVSAAAAAEHALRAEDALRRFDAKPREQQDEVLNAVLQKYPAMRHLRSVQDGNPASSKRVRELIAEYMLEAEAVGG